MPEFPHRVAAGDALADQICAQGYPNPAVVAIPKGGIPVAAPLARHLGLPIELCLVAKVPLPWRPEAGIGALAADGTLLLNHELIHVLALKEETVSQSINEARSVLAKQSQALEAFAQPPELKGKTAIVVDDGMATGYTALTAAEVLRPLEPQRIVVAAPVGSIYALETLAAASLEAVVLTSGDGPFFDVASYYGEFEELDEAQVRRLLERPNRPARAAS